MFNMSTYHGTVVQYTGLVQVSAATNIYYGIHTSKTTRTIYHTKKTLTLTDTDPWDE